MKTNGDSPKNPEASSLAGTGSSGNSPPAKAAKAIKKLHDEILGRDRQNTPLAIQIGQKLLDVKKSKYGNNYKRWSQNECGLSYPTVLKYERLALAAKIAPNIAALPLMEAYEAADKQQGREVKKKSNPKPNKPPASAPKVREEASKGTHLCVLDPQDWVSQLMTLLDKPKQVEASLRGGLVLRLKTQSKTASKGGKE